MKTWQKYLAGLAAMAGFTPGLWAQLPALPSAAGGVAGAAGQATGAASQGSALIGLLCPSPEQAAMLKAKFCNHPLGKLLSNGAKIPQAFTGGIINECCPSDAVNLNDLKKDGAEGLAAAIKAEEADAKARRAAARYLGTVDCHYFPEVSKAGFAGLLRADRNECVRWEAAMALGRGCCCNKTTIQALALTVSGSEKDGNPSEKSERVKQAAAASLHHCLACVGTVPAEEVPVDKKPLERPETPTRPEAPPPPKAEETTKRPGNLQISGVQPSVYYQRNEGRSLGDICEDGRKALAEYSHSAQTAMPSHQGGRRSLVEMWQFAMHGPAQPVPGSQEVAGDAGAKIDFAHASTMEPPVQPVPTAPAKVVVPASAPQVQPMPVAPAKMIIPASVPQVQPAPAAPSKVIVPASAPQVQTTPPAPAKVMVPTSAPVLPALPAEKSKFVAPVMTPTSPPAPAKSGAPVPAPQAETLPKLPVKETHPIPMPTLPAMPAAPSKVPAPVSAAPVQPMPLAPVPTLPVQPMPAAPVKSVEPSAGPTITPTSYAPKSQPTTLFAESKVQPVIPGSGSMTPAQSQTPKAVAPAPVPQPAAKVAVPAPVPPRAPVAPGTASMAQLPVESVSPVNARQLLQVLAESPYPEQREWAAERLAGVSGPTRAMVVQAMVKAAKEDGAPTVQVACIRSLVKLNQGGQDLTTTLTSLKSSGDPRVRYEAGQALGKLGTGQNH